MKPRTSLVLALVVFAANAVRVAAERPEFRPEHRDAVLVRLPRGVGFPGTASLPGPTLSVTQAVSEARALARQARRTGDPRCLGRAQALLHPWWTEARPPLEVLLLRAEIRQGLHEFRPALADLDAALALDPRCGGAWLTKAALHQVIGEYGPARAACFRAASSGAMFEAATLAAGMAGLGLDGKAAADSLATRLAEAPSVPTESRAWAWTTLGELRAWQGDSAGAESALREALKLDPTAPYATAVLADLLLDQRRPAEVLLLIEPGASDALRLRLAEARLRLSTDDVPARQIVRELAAAFALAHARGDELHLREEARFELRLREQPSAALRLARRNWEIQKEPADLALLIEAARAAGDSAARADAVAWARLHQPAVLARLRVHPPLDSGI